MPYPLHRLRREIVGLLFRTVSRYFSNSCWADVSGDACAIIVLLCVTVFLLSYTESMSNFGVKIFKFHRSLLVGDKAIKSDLL